LRRPPGAQATDDAIAVFSDGMDPSIQTYNKHSDSEHATRHLWDIEV